MKEELCRAFCDGLTVTEVPAGLAVGTPFRRPDGDTIGFYVVGPDATGRYHVEDDGFTMANLEALGADLETATRADTFHALLREYGAVYEEALGTLASGPLAQSEVAPAALRFAALLLRLQDLAFLTPERVASTFREEAVRAISFPDRRISLVRPEEEDGPDDDGEAEAVPGGLRGDGRPRGAPGRAADRAARRQTRGGATRR